jgi:hypothetical protein
LRIPRHRRKHEDTGRVGGAGRLEVLAKLEAGEGEALVVGGHGSLEAGEGREHVASPSHASPTLRQRPPVGIAPW